MGEKVNEIVYFFSPPTLTKNAAVAELALYPGFEELGAVACRLLGGLRLDKGVARQGFIGLWGRRAAQDTYWDSICAFRCKLPSEISP